jgi:hypothetical protein
VANNLMQGTAWGLKTFYYSLINKDGTKHDASKDVAPVIVEELLEEDDCEACRL